MSTESPVEPDDEDFISVRLENPDLVKNATTDAEHAHLYRLAQAAKMIRLFYAGQLIGPVADRLKVLDERAKGASRSR